MLEIKKYPNPVLRKKCEEVIEITEDIKKLSQEMIKILEEDEEGDGIGLAASQVGELKRIIVVKFGEGSRAFFNPEIIKKNKETEIAEEGCLSVPGLFLKIKRAKEIAVEALNERGEKIRFKAKDMLARVFQHEIDHLDGILIIDRISFWQKLKLKKKLKESGANR